MDFFPDLLLNLVITLFRPHQMTPSSLFPTIMEGRLSPADRMFLNCLLTRVEHHMKTSLTTHFHMHGLPGADDSAEKVSHPSLPVRD